MRVTVILGFPELAEAVLLLMAKRGYDVLGQLRWKTNPDGDVRVEMDVAPKQPFRIPDNADGPEGK